MSHFLMLVKMNFKLLLRNKGFLFFLLLTPIVSVLILNIKLDDSSEIINKDISNDIIELKSIEDRSIYNVNPITYAVKVYDASESGLSDYLLNSLADTGMYAVCRVKIPEMTSSEAKEQAKKDAFGDRNGTILYLEKDFDEHVIKGDYQKLFIMFNVSEDERTKMFKQDLTTEITRYNRLVANTGGDEASVVKLLKKIDDSLPKCKSINVSSVGNLDLTKEQNNAKTLIGYSLAIITLGFLFCGVCVASTVIEEQNNKVYTRIMLTKVGRYEYLLSKLVICFFITLTQTGIMGICMFVIGNRDFLISKASFLLMIFLLGLIFCLISLSVGILIGDVMGANYATFAIWSISGLFAGLYFPVDSLSETIKMMSKLVPQHWVLKASEMIMTGDKSAYVMILCITVAYVLITLSIGVIGLKLKRED